jgi:hypothetical protein
MTPSERIKLITGIADTLACEEWALIDLTLRQFGLPTSEVWNGPDKQSYIISMTESATDEGAGPQKLDNVISSKSA